MSGKMKNQAVKVPKLAIGPEEAVILVSMVLKN